MRTPLERGDAVNDQRNDRRGAGPAGGASPGPRRTAQKAPWTMREKPRGEPRPPPLVRIHLPSGAGPERRRAGPAPRGARTRRREISTSLRAPSLQEARRRGRSRLCRSLPLAQGAVAIPLADPRPESRSFLEQPLVAADRRFALLEIVVARERARPGASRRRGSPRRRCPDEASRGSVKPGPDSTSGGA